MEASQSGVGDRAIAIETKSGSSVCAARGWLGHAHAPTIGCPVQHWNPRSQMQTHRGRSGR